MGQAPVAWTYESRLGDRDQLRGGAEQRLRLLVSSIGSNSWGRRAWSDKGVSKTWPNWVDLGRVEPVYRNPDSRIAAVSSARQ